MAGGARTPVRAMVALSMGGWGPAFNLGWFPPSRGGMSCGPPVVYGGVQNDVGTIDSANRLGGDQGLGMAGLYLLADVPLSFVADTLTLPIPICVKLAWQALQGDSPDNHGRQENLGQLRHA